MDLDADDHFTVRALPQQAVSAAGQGACALEARLIRGAGAVLSLGKLLAGLSLRDRLATIRACTYTPARGAHGRTRVRGALRHARSRRAGILVRRRLGIRRNRRASSVAQSVAQTSRAKCLHRAISDQLC